MTLQRWMAIAVAYKEPFQLAALSVPFDDDCLAGNTLETAQSQHSSSRPQKLTASTQWYGDSKDWKSRMGVFSAVTNVSTHANNMDGLFVRKLVSCTSPCLQLHKLLPLVLLTTHDNALLSLAAKSVGYCYRACCRICASPDYWYHTWLTG
jgi:hypothetical protein